MNVDATTNYEFCTVNINSIIRNTHHDVIIAIFKKLFIGFSSQ